MPSNADRSILYRRIKALSAKRGISPRVRFSSYNTLKAELDRLKDEGLQRSQDEFRLRKEKKKEDEKSARDARREKIRQKQKKKEDEKEKDEYYITIFYQNVNIFKVHWKGRGIPSYMDPEGLVDKSPSSTISVSKREFTQSNILKLAKWMLGGLVDKWVKKTGYACVAISPSFELTKETYKTGTYNLITYSDIRIIDAVTQKPFKKLRVKSVDPPMYYDIGIGGNTFQFKNECSLDALLDRYAGQRRFKNLTRESLYGWFVKNCDDIDSIDDIKTMGVSVENIIAWGRKHKISMYMLDPFNNIYEDGCFTGLNKQPIFFRVNNDHLYLIDNKQIQDKLINNVGKTGECDNPFKRDINFTDWSHEKIMTTYGTFNDIMSDIYKYADITEDQQVFKVLVITDYYDIDHHSMNIQSHNHLGLSPFINEIFQEHQILVSNLSMCGNRVVRFSYADLWVVIDTNYSKYQDLLKGINSITELKDKSHQFHYMNKPVSGVSTDLYELLVGEMPSSFMSMSAVQFIMADRMTAICKTFQTWDSGKRVPDGGVALDKSRHYTSVLMERTMDYPVYSPRDAPELFKGKSIKIGGYKLYSVKVVKLLNGNVDVTGYLDCEFVQCLLNKNLIELTDIEYFIKPSFKWKRGHLQKFIERVYSMKTDADSFKKELINVLIGGLGKVKKTNTESVLTTSLDVISATKELYPNLCYSPMSFLENQKPLYVMSNSNMSEVQHNNLPIYNAVLQMGIMYMDDLWENVKTDKSVLYGIQTDCLYMSYARGGESADNIRALNAELYPHTVGNVDRISKIGKIRKETWGCRNHKSEDYGDEVTTQQVADTSVKDIECDDLKNILELFIEHGLEKGCVIAGRPGVRKSSVLMNFVKAELDRRDLSYACATTSNKAVLRIKVMDEYDTNCFDQATTLESLLMWHGGETENQYWERLLSYDYLIVDEYTMSNYGYMMTIYEIWRRNAGKTKIIMCGDENQLKSVDPIYGTMMYMGMPFFHEMTNNKIIRLTKSYRMNEALNEVVNDIIDNDRINMKHFKRSNGDIKSRNICYTNQTRRNVNTVCMDHFAELNTKMGKPVLTIAGKEQTLKLVEHSIVVFKENKKADGLFNNMELCVTGWDEVNMTITLSGAKELISHQFSFKDFAKLFISGHCLTTHCLQGSTLDDEIVIHEIDKFHKSLALTALSRNKDNTKVFINHPQWGERSREAKVDQFCRENPLSKDCTQVEKDAWSYKFKVYVGDIVEPLKTKRELMMDYMDKYPLERGASKDDMKIWKSEMTEYVNNANTPKDEYWKIEQVESYNVWGTVDCDKMHKLVGWVYGLEHDGKIFYVGSTIVGLDDRLKGHLTRYRNGKNAFKMYDHMRRMNMKEEDVKIVLLEEVKYNNMTTLKKKEYKALQDSILDGRMVYNTMGINVVKFNKDLIVTTTTDTGKKVRDVRGSIMDIPESNRFRFKYFVDGKEKIKYVSYKPDNNNSKAIALDTITKIQMRTYNIPVVIPLKPSVIKEEKELVVVVYYEYSDALQTKQKQKKKQFRVTKKRTLASTIELAKEFIRKLHV